VTGAPVAASGSRPQPRLTQLQLQTAVDTEEELAGALAALQRRSPEASDASLCYPLWHIRVWTGVRANFGWLAGSRILIGTDGKLRPIIRALIYRVRRHGAPSGQWAGENTAVSVKRRRN
jgi:hypothetical protein